MANFCSNCGHALDGAGAFCRYCGAPLAAAPAAPVQQPAQQQANGGSSYPSEEMAQTWEQQRIGQDQYWMQTKDAHAASQPVQQFAQQPAQQQWQQPQQQWQPQPQQPQWQQPTGAWSPPRTQPGAGQQSAQPWNQPTAANEWHAAPISNAGSADRRSAPPISIGINARVGSKVWSTRTGPTVSPAQAVTDAVENWQDRRRGTTQPMTNSGVPAPGWSDRVNDPELLAALAKQKKSARRVAGILVPFPLVGFAIYGMVSDSMELGKALIYGAIVSAVFLIFALIGKRQSSSKNAYEGVVVDKQTRRRRRRESDGDGGSVVSTYNELITVVQTNSGEQKKITERDDTRTLAWDYLQVGERFRYHPEHAFPYELYDKSHAPCLYCVVCQKKHPVTADRCSKCGAPLLK